MVNTRLSLQERRILSFAATGKSNLQIAEELKIMIGTVKEHLSNAADKLDEANLIDSLDRHVHSTARTTTAIACVAALELGLIPSINPLQTLTPYFHAYQTTTNRQIAEKIITTQQLISETGQFKSNPEIYL